MSVAFSPILQRGAVVPQLSLPNLTGQTVSRNSYRGRKHLALIFLDSPETAGNYLQELAGIAPSVESASGTVLVIVHAQDRTVLQALADQWSLPFPLLYDAEGTTMARFLPSNVGAGLFIIDRYGELYYQALAADVGELPPVSEVVAWLEAVDHQCSV